MNQAEPFWLLAGPVLMAVAAVGAVLFIKISRRRAATRDPRHTDAVPALPLSAADARHMIWVYGLSAALVLLVVALVGLWLSRLG